MDAPDTVVEALDLLAAEGYTEDFSFQGPSMECAVCGHRHGTHLVADRQFRFEGASDPDDEAIVLGVRCEVCGAKGRLSAAYGPSMDLDVAAALRHVTIADDAADPG